MTLVVGDSQSVGTFGWIVTDNSEGTAPGAPTISVVNDGTGTSATATVDGDAGVTNQLYYKLSSASAWTIGESRSGDGAITQAGLDNSTYYDFIVIAQAGGYNSLPSSVASVRVTDASASALLIDLPEAIVDELNAGSFSKAFTATRAAVPDFDRKDMDTLRVTVVPRTMTSAVLTRSDDNRDAQINIGIQQAVDGFTNAIIDPFLDFTEEILDYLNRKNLTVGTTTYLWQKSENAPIYAPEHLKERRQFTAILTMTYREIR